MSATPDRFVEVYRTRNAIQAHAIRVALEAADITVFIDGELLQGVVGDLPLGWVTAPRILVEENMVGPAWEIIKEFDAKPPPSRNEEKEDGLLTCLACGGTMGETEVCPACGWTYGGLEESESE